MTRRRRKTMFFCAQNNCITTHILVIKFAYIKNFLYLCHGLEKFSKETYSKGFEMKNERYNMLNNSVLYFCVSKICCKTY